MTNRASNVSIIEYSLFTLVKNQAAVARMNLQRTAALFGLMNKVTAI